MADRHIYKLMRHIRRLAGAPAAVEHSDGQLLEDFAARGDEAAFSTLVERHGPMVLSVCRRVLKDPHSADDAFQATFLVLVRKAGAISRPERLGNWLFGVALRVARRGKTVLCRQRAREIEGGNMHEFASGGCQPPDPSQPPVSSAILEELERLPAKYRAPLISLYLQGKTKQETARQMGCPEGTVSTWLARGRDMLRARLERRGVSMSAAALTAGLSADATAAVPAALANATVKAAALFAAGKAAAAAGISAHVATLTEGALQAMFVTKIKIAAVLLLSIGLAGGATGVVMHQALAEKEGVKTSEVLKTSEVWPASGGRKSPEPANTSPEAAKDPDPAKPPAGNQPRTDFYGDPLPPGALARLGTRRFRYESFHSGHVAVSPDGKTLALGYSHGTGKDTVRLWESASGKEIRQLSGGTGPVVFSPDGKTLASGVSDGTSSGTIRLWEAASGKEILSLKGASYLLAFSPDGKILTSMSQESDDNAICLWDVVSGKELRRCKGHEDNPFTSVAFSPDGKTLALGCVDNTIRLWKVASGKEILVCGGHKGKKGGVCSVAFSPDGKTLASGGADTAIRLWEVSSGKEIRLFKGHQGTSHSATVHSVAFSPDGKGLASAGDDGTIRLWEASSGKEIRAWESHQAHSAVFLPDGKTLASTSGNNIRLWEAASGQEIRVCKGHKDTVSSVAFSPDGKTLASMGSHRDKTIRLWEAASGKELRAWMGVDDKIGQNYWEKGVVAFSPDGKNLASGGSQNKSILWETASGKEIRAFGSAGPLAFSPNGKILASGGHLWEAASGKGIRAFGSAGPFVFSPDGKTLASGSMTQVKGGEEITIHLWESASGKEIRAWKGHFVKIKEGLKGREIHGVFSIAFSPDGKTLASGGLDHTIRLWEAASGKEIRAWKGCSPVVFSPDGKILASVNDDGTLKIRPSGPSGRYVRDDGVIRLWEVASGKEIRAFVGHKGLVNSVAFSPDGKSLASGSDDTTILIWDVAGLGETVQPPPIVDDSPKNLSPKQLESLWADLAGDATKAYQAIESLRMAPKQTVSFLHEHLRPVVFPPFGPERFASLMAELDDEQFTVREKASRALEQFEKLAEPALRKALDGQPSLEMRRRIERVLEKLDPKVPLSPQQLQALRAVQVLEQLASPEAQEMLTDLAKGAKEARLTQDAKESLERLSKRK